MGGEGFIVEGRTGVQAWRLEWGPSQRSYVQGQELRLRADMGLPPELQAVVLNRELQEQGEREVFEQYVEGVQTRIDSATPPELRWLVMFPKLAPADLGPAKDRFVALGSLKAWLVSWLSGPLAEALASQPLEDGQHLAVVVARGRMTLRTRLPQATLGALQAWLQVFDAAVAEARRAAEAGFESGAPSTPPSSSFPSSDLPRAG